MGVEAYIKPVNYEISKTRKYQRNRYKTENMPYDEETDSFICPNGRTHTAIGTAHRKSKSGFTSEVTLHLLSRNISRDSLFLSKLYLHSHSLKSDNTLSPACQFTVKSLSG